MLDRFIWCETNFWYLFWAMDCDLVHQRHRIAQVRRLTLILLILCGICLVQYFEVIDRQWCCYPSGSYADYNLGTCDYAAAPIHSSDLEIECTIATVPLGEWILIGAMLLLGSVFLGLHVYDSKHVIRDLKTSTLAHAEMLTDGLGSCSVMSATTTQRVQTYFRCLFHPTTLQDRQHPLLEHGVPAIVPILIARKMIRPDLIGSFIGTGQIVMKHWKRWGVVIFNDLIIVANIMVYTYVTKPHWATDCCKPPDLMAARYGSCADSHAPINREPGIHSCDLWTYTWGIWIYYIIHVLNGLVALLLAINANKTCMKAINADLYTFFIDMDARIEADPSLANHLHLGVDHALEAGITEAIYADYVASRATNSG